MPNKRVYFPVHYLALAPHGLPASGIPVHGLQSIDSTTTFDLEQILELGQLEAYANIEALPQIEITAEKALDGYPLIYHLGTPEATSTTLANRTLSRCDAIISVFSDAQDSSSGTPEVQAYCSGVYVNSLSYNFPVDGNFTESVTFVGNHKVWRTSGFFFNGHFDGTDSPAFGEILRRQHVKMGAAAASGSEFPSIIPGMTIVGGVGYNMETDGAFDVHLQDITISTNLGRDDIFELGRKDPYYRYVTFPTPVDTSIGVTAGGAFPGDGINADPAGNNLSDETIVIRTNDGMIVDLGDKNKLQSVNVTGGGTDGGLQTITYNFQNQNKLDVIHPADPYVGVP